jgi:hypothetical protein
MGKWRKFVSQLNNGKRFNSPPDDETQQAAAITAKGDNDEISIDERNDPWRFKQEDKQQQVVIYIYVERRALDS